MLRGKWVDFFFGTVKEFHCSKLLVGDAQNAHHAAFGQQRFHSPDVHVGVLFAGAMPQVDRKLKHHKTIFHDVLAKLSCNFALLFCFGWQVIEYQDPHNSIFTKALHFGKDSNKKLRAAQDR